jgi:NAD(P)-dependent dehydrogenase (short-subunit alcohol dehydrogenase family)
VNRHANANANGHNIGAPQEARCVALTQARRGHGQSTLTWYLARALVAAGLRVLVVDITGRHERLDALMASQASAPLKNLGIWKPSLSRPAQLPTLLQAARQQTRGKVDVILLDCDVAPLESAGEFASSIDYLLMLIDPTENGQKTAEHLAERLGDAPPPMGRLGVVFCRVNAAETQSFPEQTEDRHLPVLGSFPADYLLASDDSSQRRGSPPAIPHSDYLQAVQRLSRTLIGLAQLRRIPPPQPPAPHDSQEPQTDASGEF